MERKTTVIENYVYRYPQLTLPVESGMSKSERYKDIVLRGKFPLEYHHEFRGSTEDTVYHIMTPAGEAEVLYLAERKDFERMVQILAYKCEKEKIPASMGAITIRGINNWHKIKEHKKEYLVAGGTDWPKEFRIFREKAENYKDTLLILSKGAYSALSHNQTRYEERMWEELSLTIRMYHELTHMVCRTLYPDKVDVLWDEIVADCFGILKAIGYYDVELACKCLGVEQSGYRMGGRLENYIKEGCHAKDYCHGVLEYIEKLADFLKENTEVPYWNLLCLVEENKEIIYNNCEH